MTSYVPRPPKRIRNPELLRELHIRWRGDCALDSLSDCVHRYSLHHILNKPRDDVEANLVMLCGDGTTGHHGLLTANHHVARRTLGAYILAYRHDTLVYLTLKLGGQTACEEWLRRLMVT